MFQKETLIIQEIIQTWRFLKPVRQRGCSSSNPEPHRKSQREPRNKKQAHDRQTDRQTHTLTQRQRHTHTDRDAHTDTDTHRDRAHAEPMNPHRAHEPTLSP